MRFLALLLFVASVPALAGDYVPLRERLAPDELGAIGLTDAQVERLDAALRAAGARERTRSDAGSAFAPAPRTEATAAMPAARSSPAMAPVAEPVAALSAPRSDGPPQLGLGDTPIRSRLVGRVTGWSPGTVFVLANGQRWQVLKGSATLPKPLDQPDIEVVPGLSGRWFLQVTEDMPKARVYLVD